MTISFLSQGATASDASSITPAYSVTPSAGQLGVLYVASGHPDDSVPVTPSGWTLAGSLSGGGGTFGAGVGPRRITMFVREMTGADAQPTTSIPSGGSGSVIAGAIALLSRSAGTGWRWAWSAGDDSSGGTLFSAACTPDLSWAVGDFAWWGYSVADSASGLSSAAITATAVTFDTPTAQLSAAVTTGNGLRIGAASASVTAGPGTAAPTVTATTSDTTGAAGVLRLREGGSDITATAQSVFPPRNLVSVTGLEADDITSVTVYRQQDTNQTAVRAASGIDTTGTDVLLRVDAEQPLGVAINYAALLTDVHGTQWTVFSGPITSTVDGDVISDAVQGTGAKVFIEDWADKKRTRDATQFNVGGRIVVVGKKRSAAQATVTVSTDTDEDGNALQDVLDGATEGVILIRKQVTLAGVDGYLALLDDDERRDWQTEYRAWDLDVVETEAWPDVLEAAGFTLADIAANFSTLADIAAFFTGTLLDIALYDFGT